MLAGRVAEFILSSVKRKREGRLIFPEKWFRLPELRQFNGKFQPFSLPSSGVADYLLLL